MRNLCYRDVYLFGGFSVFIVCRTHKARKSPSVEQYFEGGTSICRNATIQKIFGFIGGGERAGSGADTIAKGWEFNHWPKPRIREKYDPRCAASQKMELNII